MALSGKFIVETKQELGKENFVRDLKENLKACTPRKKMDRIVEVKCHKPPYSTCVDGELSTVADFAVSTNWLRDRLALGWRRVKARVNVAGIKTKFVEKVACYSLTGVDNNNLLFSLNLLQPITSFLSEVLCCNIR
jgi:hypothetical protein